MNSGKRFEQNFKYSIPNEVFYYRFKDGTANWSGGSNQNVRFQAKNICDCMLYYNGKMFLLELKSHKGKSLPLSCIRTNQIEELLDSSEYKGIIAGLVIEFSDLKEYYFINIRQFKDYFEMNPNKKSIPIQFLRDNCYQFSYDLKKINVRLDILPFIFSY